MNSFILIFSDSVLNKMVAKTATSFAPFIVYILPNIYILYANLLVNY